MAGVRTARANGSTPATVSYPVAPAGAPNVVVVVLDDVGFAQLGCFGAPIETPSLDRVAAAGLRYNRFHVTSVCSPTRACVLTGRNHHAVGMGLTQESTLSFPGYTGRIPRSAATLARILRDGGYSTLAVGKWHLAPKSDYSAAGPFDRWPLGLGFERFYGFLGAETNQWAPELVRDNTHVDAPRSVADGYHLTEDLVDEAIRMVQDQHQAVPDKPFFLYLALGAAHAPHHVAPEWSEQYRGRFDGGWEAYRATAHATQLRGGVIPAGTELTERPPWLPSWSDLSADERRLYARYMEVYAGFLTHADAHLGRLLSFLDAVDVASRTLLLVLSDNGASAEGGRSGTLNEAASWLGRFPETSDAIARIDEIGSPSTYNHYPLGWAWAGNAPFRLWKRYAWLGGTRTPLIVRWPERIDAGAGAVRPQFCHAVDVFSTVLDAAGVPAPEEVDGVIQQPVDGVSLLATFDDADAAEVRRLQYFELAGSRAIYHDGWKATTDHVANQFGERDLIAGSYDFDDDHWALFNLDEDFSESNDVAAAEPDRARRLEELWWAEAGRNQVLPLFEFPGSMRHAHPGEFPAPAEAVYRVGGGPVIEGRLPAFIGGFSVRASFELAGEGGMICAFGDRHEGWAMYVIERRVTFVLSSLGSTVRLQGGEPVAAGGHTAVLEYFPGPEGRLRLTTDGASVAEAPFRDLVIFPGLSTAGAGLLVGRDRGLAVSDDYEPPFVFAGAVHEVRISSGAPAASPDDETAGRLALSAD